MFQSRVIARHDVWEEQWYVSLTRDWKWGKHNWKNCCESFQNIQLRSAVELAFNI